MELKREPLERFAGLQHHLIPKLTLGVNEKLSTRVGLNYRTGAKRPVATYVDCAVFNSLRNLRVLCVSCG